MAELTAQTDSHLGLECGRKPNGQRVAEVRKRLEFGQDAAINAWEKKRFL